MWQQIREINQNGVITFTDEKHKRIAEIGTARFYKEKRNKKNLQKKV